MGYLLRQQGLLFFIPAPGNTLQTSSTFNNFLKKTFSFNEIKKKRSYFRKLL